MTFPISDSAEPDFLTADILPFITCAAFLIRMESRIIHSSSLSTRLDDFCLTNEGWIFSTAVFDGGTGKYKKAQIMLRYNTITSDIAGKIGDEIRQHFTDLSDENKNDFIAEIFGNDENCNEIKEDHSKFGEKVQEKQMVWKVCLTNYLDSCVKNMALNKIEVSGNSVTGRSISMRI